MSIIKLIKKNIRKGYRLEAKFLEECEFSVDISKCLGSSFVSEKAYHAAVRYFLNGKNKPNNFFNENFLISYGKLLYRLRHPELVLKTIRLRFSFEDFHKTYGLRLENS